MASYKYDQVFDVKLIGKRYVIANGQDFFSVLYIIL